MTRPPRAFFACLGILVCLLAAACAGETAASSDGGGTGADAGADAGIADTGPADTGTVDGGAPDAGPADEARAAAAAKDSPNTPDPSALGPYPVGVTTSHVSYVYDDGKGGETRDLPVEIWYPADDAARGMEKEAMDLKKIAPAWVVEKVTIEMKPIPTDAVRDAPVRQLGEAFPLVLFSHGAGGIRQQSIFFTVTLASHGFVVASMDHVGGTAWDLLDPKNQGLDQTQLLADGMPRRPKDFAAVLEWMLLRNETAGDLLNGQMNPRKIGATGHSFGAYTAVAVAADRRIRAVVPMAAPTNLYDENVLARFPPVMIHGATKDKTVDYQEQQNLYASLHKDRYFVGLTDGGHFSYSDLCSLPMADIAKIFNLNIDYYMSDGCGADNLAPAEAHRLINKFSIGFLDAYLRGSRAMYEKYLTPADAALEPQIVFESDEAY